MPSPRSALPVVLLVVLAGCSGGPPPSDPTAERVLNESLDALGDVEAYTYSLSGEAKATAGDQRESLEFTGRYALNATQHRLRASVVGDEDNETVFVDGRTVYAACPFSRYVNVADAWYPALTLPENRSWRGATDLAAARLFRDAPAYDDGTETLDGTRTHVVTVRPSPAAFGDLEARTTLPPAGADRGHVENVTVRLWIDAETSRPVRIRLRQVRSVEDVTIRAEYTMRYRYRPTTVALPPTVPAEEACPEPS
jgi:hypothetical protein